MDRLCGCRGNGTAGRHGQSGVLVWSADWSKAGLARQRAGPTSLGFALRIHNSKSTPPHPVSLYLQSYSAIGATQQEEAQEDIDNISQACRILF